ncbi:ABC transporter permease [Oscillospiraceae bacterium CM]|nr:ABC transporter permease [Oscillospiraceae bacterium CM]
MTAIYKREVRSYFFSMIGCIYAFVVLLVIGLMFLFTNLLGGYPYFAITIANWLFLLVMVFAVPFLTMRSLAEERRAKTDQMLLTYPVSVSQVILGKFFAMVTVYAVPLIISCLIPLIISWDSAGAGSLMIDFSAILALICLGFLFVSVGMFISSLTESQVIAAVLSMGVLLLLFLWSDLVSLLPQTVAASLIGFFIILLILLFILYHLSHNATATAFVGLGGALTLFGLLLFGRGLLPGLLNKILGIFSVTETINNFSSYNVFDLKGLLFFLSFAALFVFLTIQSVSKRRWS